MVSPTRSTLLDDIREFWKSPLKRGVLFLTGFTALWFCFARVFPGARNVPFGIPIYMCMFVCLTAMICLINAQINYSSKKRLGKSKTFIITCATVTAVIVGILFIGLVVTAVMAVFDRIQGHLLRWQAKYAEH